MTNVVVVSRSCPPDVGGYQTQFTLVLPLIGTFHDVEAFGALRQSSTSPGGWPGVRSSCVPAYRIPRLIRGFSDYVVTGRAGIRGLALRAGGRPPCTLLVLSPGMRGAVPLVRVWDRWIGPVVLRVPGPGSHTRRLETLGRTGRTLGVGPGPAQLAAIERVGLPSAHIPNIVEPAARSDAKPIIAVVGRLIAGKRVDLAVSAWSSVADRHPEWSLAIVGSGQHERDSVEADLRARVDREAVPRVVFHGEVPDPWETVGDASVLVFASEREGSPNVILEALARGIAVIGPSQIRDWFDPLPPHLTFAGSEDLAGAMSVASGSGDAQRPGRRGSRIRGPASSGDRRSQVARRTRERRSPTGACRMGTHPDSGVATWTRARRRQRPFPQSAGGCAVRAGSIRGDRAAVIDRPFVIADAAALPFHDGAFHLAIASHLVEHVDDPGAVVAELARVAAEGYVETPHRRFERLAPESNHLWAVEVREGALRCGPNPYAALHAAPTRRAFNWVYHAGESTPRSTMRLPGPANEILRHSSRLFRGVLNRTGVTTARYRFGRGNPPNVERP